MFSPTWSTLRNVGYRFSVIIGAAERRCYVDNRLLIYISHTQHRRSAAPFPNTRTPHIPLALHVGLNITPPLRGCIDISFR